MTQKLYITSDGYPAYLQDDGTLTDMPTATGSDMTWDSLAQLMDADPDTREATQEDHKRFAKIRAEHDEWLNDIGLL